MVGIRKKTFQTFHENMFTLWSLNLILILNVSHGIVATSIVINSYKMNIQVDESVRKFYFFSLCFSFTSASAAYQMNNRLSKTLSNISTTITWVLCLIYFQIQANDSKFVFIIHVKRRKWRKNAHLSQLILIEISAVSHRIENTMLNFQFVYFVFANELVFHI